MYCIFIFLNFHNGSLAQNGTTKQKATPLHDFKKTDGATSILGNNNKLHTKKASYRTKLRHGFERKIPWRIKNCYTQAHKTCTSFQLLRAQH
jgi:hypothetical protein